MTQLRCWILCEVVDNFGDAGVCWRLARQLSSEHGFAVTLLIDRPQTLAALEPRLLGGASTPATLDGVHVETWPHQPMQSPLPDILVSAFGCEPPAWLRARMAGGPRRPIWINLEYLSAEPWVEGCHRLTSLKPSDGAIQHFFFPGFTPATGGLLRERDLLERVRVFRSSAGRVEWALQHGIPADRQRRVASLFCYPDAPVSAWLAAIARADQPWLVVVPAGVAESAIASVLQSPLAPGDCRHQGALSVMRLPFLPQLEYDRLLWACDLNLVRGEDSWVRAHWAGAPFIWQAYPQADQTHLLKLEAFVERMREAQVLTGQPPSTDAAAMSVIESMMLAWNGQGDLEPAWRDFDKCFDSLSLCFRRWQAALAAQDDLAAKLARYCLDRL